ncbi:hypothetical protein [Peribacillus kribbensis]|uniref:hypothetical protein n=1 Tax=Peribacillus kribbensis TaxID=356658 RepID=UPI0004167F61|nr:hypothetical protein [Peribacillus kribbensis]
MDVKTGGTGEGAAIAAAFMGIILVLDGVIYLISGIVISGQRFSIAEKQVKKAV